MESWTIVAASTTVGTPIPITRTERFSSFRPSLWFPTPEPGLIPVSVIWIVRLSLVVLLAASASTAITKSGFVSETTPRTISRVSIPVCAITPGTIPLIWCIFICSLLFSPYSRITCLVIWRLETARGPRESAVISWFPSPTTRIDCCRPRSISSLKWCATSSEISLW